MCFTFTKQQFTSIAYNPNKWSEIILLIKSAWNCSEKKKCYNIEKPPDRYYIFLL